MISASLIKELREKTGAGMLDCKKALEAKEGNLEQAINWLREKGIAQAEKKASRIAAEGLAAITIKDNKAVILEVNSETDFVSKNDEFQELVKTLLETVIISDVTTLEEAMKLSTKEGTIEELLISKTAKIGERLNFRRFKLITKKEQETFGSYLHMGGRIASLVILDNTTPDRAHDIAMHVAAMNPLYLRREEIPFSKIEEEKSILKEQALNEGKEGETVIEMVEEGIQSFYKEICLEEQPFVKNNKENVKTFLKNEGAQLLKMYRYEVGEGLEKRNEDFASEVMSQLKN